MDRKANTTLPEETTAEYLAEVDAKYTADIEWHMDEIDKHMQEIERITINRASVRLTRQHQEEVMSR